MPLASASPDMIGWSRVLLSHTLDAGRSTFLLSSGGAGAGITEWLLVRGQFLLRTSFLVGRSWHVCAGGSSGSRPQE